MLDALFPRRRWSSQDPTPPRRPASTGGIVVASRRCGPATDGGEIEGVEEERCGEKEGEGGKWVLGGVLVGMVWWSGE